MPSGVQPENACHMRRLDSIKCLILTSLHINNTMFEQAADRVSSSFDTSRTRRQKGLVSAQCEIEYELSCTHRHESID
jgi:formate-dependent nitrite reductase cytochrome c552 subunit